MAKAMWRLPHVVAIRILMRKSILANAIRILMQKSILANAIRILMQKSILANAIRMPRDIAMGASSPR